MGDEGDSAVSVTDERPQPSENRAGPAFWVSAVVGWVVIAVGLTRLLPSRARATVQAALVITGVLGLFSYPLVRAYGLATHNPTSLPHNYALNLTIVLGLVWAGAAAALIVRLRRRA